MMQKKNTSRARTVQREIRHCPESQLRKAVYTDFVRGAKKPEGDCVDSISTSDGSKSQTWRNVSETTPNSDASDIVFLLEWKQRGLDREMHQDAYRDPWSKRRQV